LLLFISEGFAMREFRGRLLLGLLLGALLLSAGLNVYCLRQLDARPLNYELEAGMPVSVTELELAQARAALEACQHAAHSTYDSRPDSLLPRPLTAF
jgi:hypothetical protein